MIGLRETLCTRCSHREVCLFKDEFLRASEAVNEVRVDRPTKGKNAISFIKICDIPWIKPVELICEHYQEKQPTFRNACKEDSCESNL